MRVQQGGAGHYAVIVSSLGFILKTLQVKRTSDQYGAAWLSTAVFLVGITSGASGQALRVGALQGTALQDAAPCCQSASRNRASRGLAKLTVPD
jgi:hypothetical protein